MAKSIIHWKRLLLFPLFLLTLFCTQILAQSSLLQQGIELYETQRYSEAVEVWKTALNRDQKTDSSLDEALTRHYLSLAYQQQGNWEKATETINQSLQLLNQTPVSPLQTEITAKALNTQGRLQYLQGNAKIADQTWQQSAQLYDQIGDKNGQLIAKLNQTQALQAQGLSLQAKQHLETLQETFPKDAKTLRYLGIALQRVGELSASLATLEESLTYQETAETWLALGNTEVELGKRAWLRSNFKLASDYFNSATKHYLQANSLPNAQLNQLRLYIQTGDNQKAIQQLPQIRENLAELSLSREKANSYYNLAESLICLKTTCSQFSEKTSLPVENAPTWEEIATLTSLGLKSAQRLGDMKAKSYGLGLLGNIYEQTEQWEDAKTLTQQAYFTLRSIDAPEIAYRWEWQLGRIEAKLGNVESALSAYSGALTDLGNVRKDLVSVDSDLSFSFRRKIEPLYREYVGLLLRGEPSQNDLKKAIEAINKLQLAELENYLRCSLRPLLNLTQNLATVDPNAVYLYPILLPKQLLVIAQFPQQELKLYRHSVAEETVISTLQKLQTGILRRRSELTINSGKQLYQWLLSSLETDFENHPNLETLVFTLDPKLRNLPLSVLYDQQREEYLVDKPYGLAITPNSQLFSLEETRHQEMEVLAGGISQSLTVGKQRFSPLKAQQELSQIQGMTEGLLLLDREFTPTRLETTLKRQSFSVIHFATHAQFSSNPEETYVLTYDETGTGRLLNSDRFSGLLQQLQRQAVNNPLELLVLSACETATGDDRALLGLAGIAIQSGAPSTLATQWKVSDDSTVSLMEQFYQQLTRSGVNKAQALHQAQQKLRNNPNTQNPFFWGAYVLVGNWL